jgi:group I intron endonuclease
LEYFSAGYLESFNMYIYRALKKHGYSNFSLTILEYCEPSKYLCREDYYFKLLNPEYNTSKNSTAPMSGLTHSDETRQKISDTMKGQSRPEGALRILKQKRKTLSSNRSCR